MYQLPSAAEREAKIRAYAASIGIDPDVAVAVARQEGLQDGTWQANGQLGYGREQSYGDFQLHTDPTGKNPGLGNQFEADTGLDTADPANWWAMDKYGLDHARKNGWGAWMGAKKAGYTGMEGIGGQESYPARPTDTVAQPGAGAMPELPAPGGLLDADADPITGGVSEDEATEKDKADSLGSVGSGLISKAARKPVADVEPPKAVVLQPRRDYREYMKGLLG